MANWTYNPADYKEAAFEMIPVGDYRVRIKEVVEKKFNSGNEGYELTLEVNGFKSSLWAYLVLDPAEPAKTNQRIGDFFNSFGITSPAMGSGKQWVGQVGAVRVKHDEYNGRTSAKVAYFINRARQDSLPAWKNGGAAAPAQAPTATVDLPDDLPF